MTLYPRSWRNSDGLNVWFGTAESRPGTAGDVRTVGDNRVLEQIINLTDLTTSAQFLDTHTTFPQGAFIEQVEVVTLVAATSGGAATLNVGLKGTDESTNVSDTAVVNAMALATHNALGLKTTLVVGGTGAGSSIGIATTTKNYLTAKTAVVYTAGKVLIRIHYNFIA